MKITDFWDVMPCGLVGVTGRYRGKRGPNYKTGNVRIT